MTSSDGRSLRALWFGDDVSLLGHLHTPRGAALDLVAVICPVPFGYDNICAHRGLRILADRLAASGISAFRFDFPGSGDSDGEQTWPAWKAAVATAVSTARRETGCKQVAVIGVGLGGSITLAGLDQGLEVDKLILWGAPVRGRAWLREQRTYQRVAAQVSAPKPHSEVPPPPPTPSGLEELSGFPMTATLADELTAFNASVVSADAWPAHRARPATLVVTRTLNGDEGALTAALNARGITATVEAREGFNQMFDQPHLSIAPEPIFALMREWLVKGAAPRDASPPTAANDAGGALADGVTTRIGRDGLVQETARYQQGAGGLLFSVETRPVDREPHPVRLVLLTGRAVRHIGPNRIWVRIARELAKKGYASLRLDGRSVGDSDGEGNGLMPNEEYYQPHIYDDIEKVMETAVARGAKTFLMTGICSGATASYQIASRRSDVKAIVLLNLLQLRHDPEDDDRSLVQQALKFALRKDLWMNPDSYRKLWKVGLSPEMRKVLLSRAVLLAPLNMLASLVRRKAGGGSEEPDYVVSGFNELAQRPVEIDIFLSQGDLSVNFLERHFGADLAKLSREHIRVHRVHHTDHTIRALFAQERFFEILRAALARIST
jgi:pimeloyl-ACP methyl ester carboxylesterase